MSRDGPHRSSDKSDTKSFSAFIKPIHTSTILLKLIRVEEPYALQQLRVGVQVPVSSELKTERRRHADRVVLHTTHPIAAPPLANDGNTASQLSSPLLELLGQDLVKLGQLYAMARELGL